MSVTEIAHAVTEDRDYGDAKLAAFHLPMEWGDYGTVENGRLIERRTKCSACESHPVDPRSRFCPWCGVRLGGTGKASSES